MKRVKIAKACTYSDISFRVIKRLYIIPHTAIPRINFFFSPPSRVDSIDKLSYAFASMWFSFFYFYFSLVFFFFNLYSYFSLFLASRIEGHTPNRFSIGARFIVISKSVSRPIASLPGSSTSARTLLPPPHPPPPLSSQSILQKNRETV